MSAFTSSHESTSSLCAASSARLQTSPAAAHAPLQSWPTELATQPADAKVAGRARSTRIRPPPHERSAHLCGGAALLLAEADRATGPVAVLRRVRIGAAHDCAFFSLPAPARPIIAARPTHALLRGGAGREGGQSPRRQCGWSTRKNSADAVDEKGWRGDLRREGTRGGITNTRYA